MIDISRGVKSCELCLEEGTQSDGVWGLGMCISFIIGLGKLEKVIPRILCQTSSQVYTVLDKLIHDLSQGHPKMWFGKGISPLIPPSIPEGGLGMFRKYNNLPEKTPLGEIPPFLRVLSNKTPRWGPWGCCNTSVVGLTLKGSDRSSTWISSPVGFWNNTPKLRYMKPL